MNLSAILPILADLPAYQQARAAVSADQRRHSLGLPPFAHTPVLAQLITDRDRPVLLVVARIEMIPIWQQALEAWLPPARKVLRFPEPTPLPYDRGPWSARSIQGRLTVLTALMAEQHPLLPSGDTPPIIITSARALLQKTTPRQRFLAATRTLRAGQIIDLE